MVKNKCVFFNLVHLHWIGYLDEDERLFHSGSHTRLSCSPATHLTFGAVCVSPPVVSLGWADAED